MILIAHKSLLLIACLNVTIFGTMSLFFMTLDHLVMFHVFRTRLLLETAMEYAKKKILVWWDLNSCQVPTDFKKVSSIAKNIRVALRNANFHGEITVKAYGDEDIIPSEVRQALYFTGISLHLSGIN